MSLSETPNDKINLKNTCIMKWYLAKIVYQIICGDGNHTAQFDEQLRLISAPDKQEALTRARELGSREEETLVNSRHQLVKWKFINVSELYRLNEWVHGAELYSRI